MNMSISSAGKDPYAIGGASSDPVGEVATVASGGAGSGLSIDPYQAMLASQLKTSEVPKTGVGGLATTVLEQIHPAQADEMKQASQAKAIQVAAMQRGMSADNAAKETANLASLKAIESQQKLIDSQIRNEDAKTNKSEQDTETLAILQADFEDAQTPLARAQALEALNRFKQTQMQADRYTNNRFGTQNAMTQDGQQIGDINNTASFTGGMGGMGGMGGAGDVGMSILSNAGIGAGGVYPNQATTFPPPAGYQMSGGGMQAGYPWGGVPMGGMVY